MKLLPHILTKWALPVLFAATASAVTVIYPDNSTQGFPDIDSAINSVGDTATVQLDANIDLTAANPNVTIQPHQTITLDLNGYSILGDNDGDIVVLGTLVFDDTVTNSTGSFRSTAPYTPSSNDTGLVRVEGNGSFTVAGGIIDADQFGNPQAEGQTAVCYYENATVKINGGTVKAGWHALRSDSALVNGTPSHTRVLISGGEVLSSADCAILMADEGSVEVSGGDITSLVGEAIRVDSGALMITGGKFTSAPGVDCLSLVNPATGSIAVSGGEFTEPVPQSQCAVGYTPDPTPTPMGLWTVMPCMSIIGVDVTVASAGTYDGQAKQPAVTVSTNGVALVQGTDYRVVGYANNVDAENADVTLEGINAWMDSTNVTFSISPALLTVEAENVAVFYGDPAAPLTYHIVAGLVPGESQASVQFTGSLVRAPGTNAGAYAISQGTLDAAGNYRVDPSTFVGATYTINPVALTVKARNYTISHGDPAPTYEFDVFGLVNGDVQTNVLTGGCTCSYVAGAGNAPFPNTFQITPTPILVQGVVNYMIGSIVDGTLTVNSRQIRIDFFDDDCVTHLYSWSFEWNDPVVYPTSAPTPSAHAPTATRSYPHIGWTDTPIVAAPGTITPLPQPILATADATYYAVYDDVPRLYTVRFLDYDTTPLYRTQYLQYNAAPALPFRPTRLSTAQFDYSFWYWTDGVSNYSYAQIPPVTADVDYMAVYATSIRQYDIHFFNYNNVQLSPYHNWFSYGSVPFYSGQPPRKPDTRSSWFQFIGWTDRDGTSTNYAGHPLPVVTGPQNYTAVFRKWFHGHGPYVAIATNYPGSIAHGSYYAVHAFTTNLRCKIKGPLVPPEGADYRFVPSPDGVITETADDGYFTATFAAPGWNQPVDWEVAVIDEASESVSTVNGRAYAKAEADWFSTDAEALDVVGGFGDGFVGVDKTDDHSADGQATRIQTRIVFGNASSVADVGDARGGIAVIDGVYRAYNGEQWIPLYGADPVDGEVDLLLIADMAAETPSIRYFIDGVSLYTFENEEDEAERIYAIPLKPVAEDERQLKAVGFSNAQGVKAPVLGGYDIPYEAAIGETGYTNAVDAVSALVAADKAADIAVTIELLKDGIGGTVPLAAGEAVTVISGTFVSALEFTASDGFKVVSEGADGVVTYSVVPDTVTVTFVNDKGDAPDAQTIATGTAATRPQDPSANGFTFAGWFAADASDPFDFATLINADLTLTAGWTASGSGDLDPFAIGDNLPDGVKAVEMIGDTFVIRAVVPQGATATLLNTSSLDEEFVELTEDVDYTSELGSDGVTTFILPIPKKFPTITFCEFYRVRFKTE